MLHCTNPHCRSPLLEMKRRNVGFDCGFVAKGETEQDILQQAAEHARSVHNINEITPEIAERVRATIKDEAA